MVKLEGREGFVLRYWIKINGEGPLRLGLRIQVQLALHLCKFQIDKFSTPKEQQSVHTEHAHAGFSVTTP